MALSPGTPAPDFELPLKPGEAPLRLSDYRGERPVVLLFFPLAFSSTCTKEMCAVAEDYGAWQELGAEVIGVSVDSPFVNQKFAAECGAPFPIVSDFNRAASRAYDVLYEEFYGLEGVSKRAAFVIDREGIVRYAWVSDDAGVMPDLDAVREAVRAAA
ncbi:MAG: peroxiredoxin [Gemmatimonadetes bacterium]|nr:MAG: peroxiredoxin [Gemmatimonadota bacterium]